MRLFLAVDIDDDTRRELARVQEWLRGRLAQVGRPPRLTWVAPTNAHVTLRFLGEQPEAVARDLQAVLEPGCGMTPFALRWGHVGTFPPGRAPRVIWIGPVAGGAQLGQLAAAVNHRIAPLVGAPDSRPFTGHLTVARLKTPSRSVDWKAVLSSLEFAATVTRVEHVTLYHSRLSPKGPTYTAVCRTRV